MVSYLLLVAMRNDCGGCCCCQKSSAFFCAVTLTFGDGNIPIMEKIRVDDKTIQDQLGYSESCLGGKNERARYSGHDYHCDRDTSSHWCLQTMAIGYFVCINDHFPGLFTSISTHLYDHDCKKILLQKFDI